MRILVLSFYFRPDLSAGSFRATALVEALRQQMPADGQIDVMTTLPNRYSSFSVEAQVQDCMDGVTVTRIALPAHKSGMVDQAKCFISYVHAVMRHTRGQHYDLVFATSSRLMSAVLAAWIARTKKVPLYLDIRDIFVDTITDVLPKCFAVLAKPFFSTVERWAIRSADRVNLVSRGFEAYFKPRYPGKAFSYFTNGIDDEFLNFPLESHVSNEVRAVQVLYAGNLGEGQGLHAIIPKLAAALREHAHFKIIGDGGRKGALISALRQEGIGNVELALPMKRQQLIDAYSQADVLFLHLNDYAAFRKVLPSKLFEYGATGKPVLAGVAGYAEEFIKLELENVAVFRPCDVADAVRALESLQIRQTVRAEFIARFARKNIVTEMAIEIVGLANAC